MLTCSVVDEQTGKEMYPRKWNLTLIDAPVVDKKKQKTPIFSGGIVTGIVSKCPERYRILFALCAASGLRMGEALGIEIEDVSPDGTVIKIRQKAWKGQIHDYLKTINGERDVDLHSSVAKLVKKLCRRPSKCLAILHANWQAAFSVEHPPARLASNPEGTEMARFRERDQAGREPCVPSFQKYVLAESHINTGRDQICRICTTRFGGTCNSAEKWWKKHIHFPRLLAKLA